MLEQPTGPQLLGFDVIVVGTILAGLAAMAVMFAIYTAVTIKDPMAKRVKSLNDRRDELKAGIVTSSAKKRASLVRKTEGTDKMKQQLEGMKVLQQSQIEDIQQKLAQAGRQAEEELFGARPDEAEPEAGIEAALAGQRQHQIADRHHVVGPAQLVA